MAGRKSYDGTLLDVVGQGAAVDGDWWEVLHGGSSERARQNIQYVVSMTAGTGTWVLEGRNGPNDPVTQIDTGTAAKTGTCARMKQFRFRWTAASGLTGRCSVNAVVKNITYAPFAIQQSVWYNGLVGGYWPDPSALFRYTAGDSLAAATVTRASSATYIDASGIIQTAAPGVARDGHYINGARCLLMEDQRTNLCLNSLPQNGSNGWFLTGTTLTAGYGTGPQGTPNRSVRLQMAGAGYSKFQLTVSANTTYTLSFWAKLASGTPFLKVTDQTDANAVVAYQSYASQLTVGQWRRVTFTFTTGAGYTQANCYIINDCTCDIEVDGAQLEQGPFASSTIFTSGATVTRSVDKIQFPWSPLPQAMTAYFDYFDVGLMRGANNYALFNLRPAALGDPSFYAYSGNPGQVLARHNNVGGTSVVSAPGISDQFGHEIEWRQALFADGSVLAGYSADGGAEVLGTQSGALALDPTWGTSPTLGIGEFNATGGFLAIKRIVFLAGVQSMTVMRAS